MGVWAWLTDAANWSGSSGIPARILEHLEISGTAMLIAVAVAIPAGLAIGHTRRGEFVAVQIANLGRAIPSFAILSIAYQLVLRFSPSLAFGFVPTVVAMVFLAVPPILTNTYVGVQQVEPDAVEAARGMGMTGMQTLRSLEVPLAAPLIVTGCRTAAVQVVATATLAALIAGGGLGRFIVDGFATNDRAEMIGGAILVAALAIATEGAFSVVARLTAPRTRTGGGRVGAPVPPVPA
ncbi:MAG: ABC transporter permease [Actinomycetota bacterium]